MTKHTNKKGKRPKGKSAKKENVESILQQAQDALNIVQLEEAATLFKQALTLKPNDTTIMDSLADVQIQMGCTHEAMLLLQESISREPHSNGVKWLYLAQLLCGNDALSAYQMGLQILEGQYQQVHQCVLYLSAYVLLPIILQQATNDLLQAIAGGYCSIAELFMTDLW